MTGTFFHYFVGFIFTFIDTSWYLFWCPSVVWRQRQRSIQQTRWDGWESFFGNAAISFVDFHPLCLVTIQNPNSLVAMSFAITLAQTLSVILSSMKPLQMSSRTLGSPQLTPNVWEHHRDAQKSLLGSNLSPHPVNLTVALFKTVSTIQTMVISRRRLIFSVPVNHSTSLPWKAILNTIAT